MGINNQFYLRLVDAEWPRQDVSCESGGGSKQGGRELNARVLLVQQEICQGVPLAQVQLKVH